MYRRHTSSKLAPSAEPRRTELERGRSYGRRRNSVRLTELLWRSRSVKNGKGSEGRVESEPRTDIWLE